MMPRGGGVPTATSFPTNDGFATVADEAYIASTSPKTIWRDQRVMLWSRIARLSGEGQQVADVGSDALLEGGKGGRVACLPQALHPGLGEILVARSDLHRCVNELDSFRALQFAEHAARQVEKRPGLPRAEIENAAPDRLLQREVQHLQHVGDVDEVPLLVPVGNTLAMAPEQAHLAGLADLIEGVEGHAGHLALVPFSESVHVEELEAGPGRRSGSGAFLLQDPGVHLQLGLAVGVEGLEPRE